jgi:membrane protease YdiL (CAAX protease family)
MFALYQAAEALQTVFRTGGPLGPLLMLLSLAIAWPLGRWLGWRGYDAYGLDRTPGWIGILIGGLLIAALAKLASLAVGFASGAYVPSTIPVGGLTVTAIGMAAVTTFVPSVAEDILTRGFLLRAVPVKLGFWSYTLGSAILYTANHIWRLDWGLSEQFRLMCLGLAYGAAAWRWRSLWGAVALHWGWNLTNALTGLAVPLDGTNIVEGRVISAVAHLVLLAVVIAMPMGRSIRKSSGETAAAEGDRSVRLT